jgi:hypothetical protein
VSTRSSRDTPADVARPLPNQTESDAKLSESADAFAERFKKLRAEQQVQSWIALRHALDRGHDEPRRAHGELHTEAAQRERIDAGHRFAGECAEELQCLHRHPELTERVSHVAPAAPQGAECLQSAQQDHGRGADEAKTRDANERKLTAVQRALRQLPAQRQYELFHALVDVATRPPRTIPDRLRKDPLLARARLNCERWQAELDVAHSRLVKYRKEHPLAARFSKDGADRERQVIAVARRLGEAAAELAQSYRRREACHREAFRRDHAAIALAQGAIPRQALRCDVPVRRLALERFAREHNALRDPNPSLVGQKFLVVQISEQEEGTFLRLSNGRRHFVIDRDAIEGGASPRLGATLQVQPNLRVTSLSERARGRSAGIDR